MRLTRTTIAHTLLAATTVALLGVYGYYYGLAWMAKWAFAHQTYFSADELILITLPQSELTSQTAYIQHEGEFEWQGEMVDVLHREVRSDTLFVYGFRDKAETRLKAQAAWLYEDAAPPCRRSDTQTKWLKWVSLVEPLYSHPFRYPSDWRVSGLQAFFAYSSPRLSRPCLEVPSPPPDL